VEFRVQPAGEDWRFRLASQASDGRGPGGVLEEVAGNRRLGPQEEPWMLLRHERSGHPHELRHHAVRMARLPFLLSALVGLAEADDADVAQWQRPLAPGTVPPRREAAREHRDGRTPPDRPPPPPPSPTHAAPH